LRGKKIQTRRVVTQVSIGWIFGVTLQFNEEREIKGWRDRTQDGQQPAGSKKPRFYSDTILSDTSKQQETVVCCLIAWSSHPAALL